MESVLKQAMDKRHLPSKILRKIKGIHYTYSLRHYKGERQISANHALIYERELGISRSELRPDFWPPEERSQDI